MLRLGVQGKAKFGNFFDISAEVAAIPYAKVGGSVGMDDVFDTRSWRPRAVLYNFSDLGNISGMRSSPTELDGWGYGAAAEPGLACTPPRTSPSARRPRLVSVRCGRCHLHLREYGNLQSGGAGTGFDTDPSFANAGAIRPTIRSRCCAMVSWPS